MHIFNISYIAILGGSVLLSFVAVIHHYFVLAGSPKGNHWIHLIKLIIAGHVLFVFTVLLFNIVSDLIFDWICYYYKIIQTTISSYYPSEIPQPYVNPRYLAPGYLEHLKKLDEFFQRPPGLGSSTKVYTQLVIATDILGGFDIPPQFVATFEEKQIVYRWIDRYLDDFYGSFEEIYYKDNNLSSRRKNLIDLLLHWDAHRPWDSELCPLDKPRNR